MWALFLLPKCFPRLSLVSFLLTLNPTDSSNYIFLADLRLFSARATVTPRVSVSTYRILEGPEVWDEASQANAPRPSS